MRKFLGYSLAALLTASVALPAIAQTGSAPGGTPAMTKPVAEAPKTAVGCEDGSRSPCGPCEPLSATSEWRKKADSSLDSCHRGGGRWRRQV